MTLGHVKLEQGHGFSAYIAPRCAGFEWEGDEGLGWYPPWMAPIMVGAAVIGAGVGAWQVTMTTYWKVGLMVVGVVMGAIGGAVIVGALINASRMITLRRRRTRFMVDGTRWRIERWRGSTLASVEEGLVPGTEVEGRTKKMTSKTGYSWNTERIGRLEMTVHGEPGPTFGETLHDNGRRLVARTFKALARGATLTSHGAHVAPPPWPTW